MPIAADMLRARGITGDEALFDLLVCWLEEQEFDCMSDLRMAGKLARLQGETPPVTSSH